MPADSWPRCWSANSPKYARRETSRSGERIPKTPHISRCPPTRSEALELHSEQGIPAGRPDDTDRDAELDRNTLHVRARRRRARDDGASAHFAEELDRILADVERGARARVERRLGEADRQPALGGVVDERRQRGDVPQERHQPRLRLEVERRRHPAELAEARLVLRARERHAATRRPRTRGRRRASPSARAGRPRRDRPRRRPASGGSPGRSSRCRARRSRRRRERRPRRRQPRCRRSPRRAPTRSPASRDCRS